MKVTYQHVTLIMLIVVALIIYAFKIHTYTAKQVIGRSMLLSENVLPKDKHLVASDANGNLELIDLNNLITELEQKMIYIKDNSKGDKGDPGTNGATGAQGLQGLQGLPGPQGSNADCVLKNQTYSFSATNANRENTCLTTDNEDRVVNDHDGARLADRQWIHDNKRGGCLTVKLH